MKHKSRKQLRQESEASASQLAELKSPEGLARFMFSKRDDEDFETAFRAEIEKLELEEARASSGDIDPSTLDSSLSEQPES